MRKSLLNYRVIQDSDELVNLDFVSSQRRFLFENLRLRDFVGFPVNLKNAEKIGF